MIQPEKLSALADALGRDPSLAALRSQFPELHFSECSEDDVSPRYRSALEVGQHALYLITGASGHCLELTNDAAAATGILLATKADDE